MAGDARKPYTAEELRELNRQLEVTGEDTRMTETIASILERLDRLESQQNTFYRQPKETADGDRQ